MLKISFLTRSITGWFLFGLTMTKILLILGQDLNSFSKTTLPKKPVHPDKKMFLPA